MNLSSLLEPAGIADNAANPCHGDNQFGEEE